MSKRQILDEDDVVVGEDFDEGVDDVDDLDDIFPEDVVEEEDEETLKDDILE